MKKTKIISAVLSAAMMLSCSYQAVMAEGNELATKRTLLGDDVDVSKLVSVNPDYISFDDYLAKYGEKNVVKGFKQAEIQNQIEVLNMPQNKVRSREYINNENEKNDLFLSLSEGKFLGLKVLGVSDLPPDNPRFSVKLERNESPKVSEKLQQKALITPTISGNKRTFGNKNSNKYYDVYCQPGLHLDNDFSSVFEEKSGAYVYKFSYSYDGGYLYSTDIDFSNADIYHKSGQDQNNAYTYIAAQQNSTTYELGLMTNVSDSYRNGGMYAYYTDLEMVRKHKLGLEKDKSAIVVEGTPKVAGNLSNNSMSFSNNPIVNIRLSVGTGSIEGYMEKDNNCIFYRVDNDAREFESGADIEGLSFLQAMSYVTPNGVTKLNTGSYFKNVSFKNSKIYTYKNGTRNFTPVGNSTYYLFACNPDCLDLNFNNNQYETISIVYRR